MRTFPVGAASLSTVVMVLALGAPSPASARDESPIAFENVTDLPVGVPPATEELAQQLMALAEKSPQSWTGVGIRADGRITVAVSSDADVPAVRASSTKLAGGSLVHVKAVGRSRADMRAIRTGIEQMWTAGEFGDVVTGVGTDSSRGVTIVYATEGSGAVRASIKRRFGDAVVFRRGTVVKAAEADRSRDTNPHFGGSGVYMWNAAHTGRRGWCSTAFPIDIAGSRYLLTAAHCVPGGTVHPHVWAVAFPDATPVPSSSYYFGRMYTTTLGGTVDDINPGTQGQYGDWALLSGSSYAPNIYNCTTRTGTCASLTIGAAMYGNPPVGSGVCTSGYSTTQVCRQVVTDEDLSTYVDYSGGSLLVNNVAQIMPAQTCGNHPGFGDSGGAVYQGISGRTGYVRAMGTLTAVAGCTAYYTKLTGVRAWNSSATVPAL